MALAPDIAARLRSEFSGDALSTASRLVESLNNDERVRRAVVYLAAGRLDQLREFVAAAEQDYRDVLWWAEYDHPDSPETQLRSMNDPFGA